MVGEIQKAYNALSAILKREGDAARDAVEELRSGPLNMPKDLEWITFVKHDNHFVDPQIPIRKIKNISYPGMDDPTAAEIRGGSLERKSKYLKSYTPGWYEITAAYTRRNTDIVLGMFCHRPIFTNSNRRIIFTLKRRSCLCTF